MLLSYFTDKNLEAKRALVMCPRWHEDRIRTQFNLTPKHMLVLTTIHTATHAPKSRYEAHLSFREWVQTPANAKRTHTRCGALSSQVQSSFPRQGFKFPCQSPPREGTVITNKHSLFYSLCLERDTYIFYLYMYYIYYIYMHTDTCI